MFRWVVDIINTLLDDVAPLANGNLSSAASVMARAGAEKRALSLAEKRRLVHTELADFFRSRDLALAASAVSVAEANQQAPAQAAPVSVSA